jgi:hypothetical protein
VILPFLYCSLKHHFAKQQPHYRRSVHSRVPAECQNSERNSNGKDLDGALSILVSSSFFFSKELVGMREPPGTVLNGIRRNV